MDVCVSVTARVCMSSVTFVSVCVCVPSSCMCVCAVQLYVCLCVLALMHSLVVRQYVVACSVYISVFLTHATF